MCLSCGRENAMRFTKFLFSSLQHRRTRLSRMPSLPPLLLKGPFSLATNVTELWAMKYVSQWCTASISASKILCAIFYTFAHQLLSLLVTTIGGLVHGRAMSYYMVKNCLLGTALDLYWGKDKYLLCYDT